MLHPVVLWILVILGLLALGLWYVTHYLIFEKAGHEGWKCLIPIYSTRIKDRIIGRSVVWLWLEILCPPLIIPFYILSCFELARSFGFGLVFGFGLLVTPWLHLSYLAFSSVPYQGPHGEGPLLRRGENPFDLPDGYERRTR
jgi:hypothetical protein